MFGNKRRKEIENILQENGLISVKDLSKMLSVSEATIRRDLTELKKQGLVERSHGGAVLTSNGGEISIFARMNKNAKEKEVAVYKAIEILPKFTTVFVDSSSTALALFERLDLANKTVVTNNLQTALTLVKKKDINLILLGGSVKFNSISSTGSLTLSELNDFYFDLEKRR
jgi:DeoR/GlpR family transcriptional regulator of sugar metabolism